MNGWIKTSDRYPGDGVSVLAVMNDEMHVLNYMNDGAEHLWHVSGDLWHKKNTVSHWMPLPEFPDAD